MTWVLVSRWWSFPCLVPIINLPDHVIGYLNRLELAQADIWIRVIHLKVDQVISLLFASRQICAHMHVPCGVVLADNHTVVLVHLHLLRFSEWQCVRWLLLNRNDIWEVNVVNKSRITERIQWLLLLLIDVTPITVFVRSNWVDVGCRTVQSVWSLLGWSQGTMRHGCSTTSCACISHLSVTFLTNWHLTFINNCLGLYFFTMPLHHEVSVVQLLSGLWINWFLEFLDQHLFFLQLTPELITALLWTNLAYDVLFLLLRCEMVPKDFLGFIHRFNFLPVTVCFRGNVFWLLSSHSHFFP